MQVRKACILDNPVLVPLIEQYWAFEKMRGFDSERVSIQLNTLLSNGRLGCGFVAMENDSAIGYILVVFVFSLEHFGITAEVDELFVSLEHRGEGVGLSLLDAAELAAQGHGCTNISLQIASENLPAKSFYARRGYLPRSDYGLMEKSLHE